MAILERVRERLFGKKRELPDIKEQSLEEVLEKLPEAPKEPVKKSPKSPRVTSSDASLDTYCDREKRTWLILNRILQKAIHGHNRVMFEWEKDGWMLSDGHVLLSITDELYAELLKKGAKLIGDSPPDHEGCWSYTEVTNMASSNNTLNPDKIMRNMLAEITKRPQLGLVVSPYTKLAYDCSATMSSSYLTAPPMAVALVPWKKKGNKLGTLDGDADDTIWVQWDYLYLFGEPGDIELTVGIDSTQQTIRHHTVLVWKTTQSATILLGAIAPMIRLEPIKQVYYNQGLSHLGKQRLTWEEAKPLLATKQPS